MLRVVPPAAAVPEVNGCIIIDSDEEEARYQTVNLQCIQMMSVMAVYIDLHYNLKKEKKKPTFKMFNETSSC